MLLQNHCKEAFVITLVNMFAWIPEVLWFNMILLNFLTSLILFGGNLNFHKMNSRFKYAYFKQRIMFLSLSIIY